MVLEKGIEYIIVANKECNSLVLSYRDKNPYISFTFYDVTSFKKCFSFDYDIETINYLLSLTDENKKHIFDYLKIKKYLNIVHFLEKNETNDENLKLFLNIKNVLLNKNLLIENKYTNQTFKNKQLIFIDLKDDIEINYLVKKYNLNAKYLGFAEFFDFLKPNDKQNVVVFNNIFQQLEYVMNSIVEKFNKMPGRNNESYNNEENINVDVIKITNEKKLENNIKIIGNIDNLAFFLPYFKKAYNLDFYYKKRTSLLNINSVKRYLNYLYSVTKNLDTNNKYPIINQYILQVNKIINQYKLNTYEFDFGFNVLNQILQSTINVEQVGDKGIEILNDEIDYKLDKEYYLLDFVQGVFPKEFTNDNILDDELLKENNINPSYQLYKLEYERVKNFITYGNFSLISYYKKHVGERIYPSLLVKDLNLNDKEYIRKREEVNDFSSIDANLKFSIIKNEKDKFNKNSIFYNVYNKSNIIEKNYYTNNFNWEGENKQEIEELKEKTFSISQIQKFSQCPFSYYLTYILKINENIDDFSIRVGNFLHKVLENVYKDDFNLEKSVEENKNNYFLNKIELILSDKIIENFKYYVDVLLDIKKNINFVKDFHEKNFKLKLEDYDFEGKIDSLIITSVNNQKYINVLDYKTNGKSFDYDEISYGVNIQLPTYILLATSNNYYMNYEIGFAAFSRLLNPNLLYIDDGVIDLKKEIDKMHFTGFLNSEEEFKKSLNSEYFKKLKSYPLYQVKNDEGITEKNINDILELTKKVIINKIKDIKNYKFDVFPIRIKKDNERNTPCTYCSFSNICYVRKNDYNQYNNVSDTDKNTNNDLSIEDEEDE